MTPDFTFTRANGEVLECYGVLEETSNISVVCEDEENDCIWTTGNPVTGKPFTNWAEAIEYLDPHFRNSILELGSV